MAEIAVVHSDFGMLSRTESVCITVFEALQNEYQPTLFTLNERDIRTLNRYCRTGVRPLETRLTGRFEQS
jgi:hypothetical protein